MRKISFCILLTSVFVATGCTHQCNPTYLSDSSAFEKTERIIGLPIRVSAEDHRTPRKKFFMKHGFATYYEDESSPVQLARPSKEIIKTAFSEGLKRYGFTLTDDACVVVNISVEKFFCTVSGAKGNEALIELDLSLREDDKTIYHKHISETYKQEFNGFRQFEDAEPLLSKCLTMAVEGALTDAEFTNQIADNAQSFQLMADKKAALLAKKQQEEKEQKAIKARLLAKRQQEEKEQEARNARLHAMEPASSRDVVVNANTTSLRILIASQVKSYLRQNLKDPSSFEAIQWSDVTKTSDGNFQVACRYRAKNSFGGYVISCQLFTLDSQGTVINVQDQ